MNVKNYLNRIGIFDMPAPDRASLARLTRAHLENVPFENLDFYEFGKEISLDPERLYEKLVQRRRGGICFELNGLFAALLEKLGYDLYLVGARIQWMYDRIRPLSHQGIVVCLPDGRYYCDVGFGGPGPKGVLSLDETGPQTVCGEEFLVKRSVQGGYCRRKEERWEQACAETFRICRKRKGDWQEVIVFDDMPMSTEDFRVLCYYYTHSRESKFMGERVVNLCLPYGSLALTGNTLTERQKSRTETGEPLVLKTEFHQESDIRRVLEERFGIRLESCNGGQRRLPPEKGEKTE